MHVLNPTPITYPSLLSQSIITNEASTVCQCEVLVGSSKVDLHTFEYLIHVELLLCSRHILLCLNFHACVIEKKER